MNIEITSDYKILKKSPRLEFPSFVVLTGENGSGKTQFLEDLKESIRIPEYFGRPNGRTISYVTNSKGIRYEEAILINSHFEIVKAPNTVDYSFIKRDWMQSDATLTAMRQRWIKISYASKSLRLNPKINETNYKNQSIIDEHNTILGEFLKASRHALAQNLDESINPITLEDLDLAFNLAKQSGKHVSELEYHDLLIFYPIELELLSSRLELLFQQNHYKQKYYPELITNDKTLIEIFNDIIKSTNFNYEATYIPSNDINALGVLKLVEKSSKTLIEIDELSSGEKNILSLIFLIFLTDTKSVGAKLILFDEPDAYLHPTLTESLINVLRNNLVNEDKIDIIFTTHSPTTVALAPEDSIFEMNRQRGYPIKIDSQKAINSLIYGVDGIFISYKDRRQVFVESENDVLFYTKIYNILRPKLNQRVHLDFISSGDSRTDKNGKPVSNSAQVKTITNTLTNFGNKNIFGIIDWDTTNTDENSIYVFGNYFNYRYSVENYLFDPLLLGIMLIYENVIKMESFGIVDKSIFDIKSFSNEELQKIVNYTLKETFGTSYSNSVQTKEVKLLNGASYELPNWFLEFQGHDIESEIINKYEALNKIKKKQENPLKVAMIEKVMLHLPEFISIDFLDTFFRIQNA